MNRVAIARLDRANERSCQHHVARFQRQPMWLRSCWRARPRWWQDGPAPRRQGRFLPTGHCDSTARRSSAGRFPSDGSDVRRGRCRHWRHYRRWYRRSFASIWSCGSTRSILVSRISSAGTTKSVALSTSNMVQFGPSEAVLHDESKLGFDTRADETIGGHHAAVGKEHVVEQNAGIRLVDIERALHRLGGEADLVTPDHAALGDLDLDPRLLDGIGILDGDAGMILRQLPDLRAGLLGLMQPLGRQANPVIAQCHGRSMPKESGRGSRNRVSANLHDDANRMHSSRLCL